MFFPDVAVPPARGGVHCSLPLNSEALCEQNLTARTRQKLRCRRPRPGRKGCRGATRWPQCPCLHSHLCLPLSATPCSSLNPTIMPQGDGRQPGPTGQAGERSARRSRAEDALERTRKGSARAGSAGRSGTARTALGCEERRPHEAEILASPTRRSTTRRESTSRPRRCGKDGARTHVRACAAESRSPKTSRS